VSTVEVISLVVALAAGTGAGLCLRGIIRRLDAMPPRIDGLYAGMARLGERLANVEAAGDAARGHLMRTSTSLPEIAIQLGRLSGNIEEERRARTEPAPDSWKAGEAALGRVTSAKAEFARLEKESFDEWLAGRGK
jgi:hypothetical protein